MDLAFEELFSVRDAFRGIGMAGKTDIQIMKEGLARHGMNPENGKLGLFCETYVRHLQREIENPRRRLKPGIRESLAALSGADGVFLGLLTGNIEAGARVKLRPFGLDSYFPLGAFGDDHEDRNKLLPIAAERFHRRYQREIAFRDCVVIGDTPRDVECAKIHGAFAVAVATGPYSYESLAASGADMVLRDISEMDRSLIL